MALPSQNSSINITTKILETPLRKRGHDQLLRRRRQRRIYRRHTLINIEETLKRLPQQIITNDPLLDQFFNGSRFI
jgi:hypothetical protein